MRDSAWFPGLSVSLPWPRSDSAHFADKAQAAIDKIEGGSHISDAEIADALFVPPEQLTTEERKTLIGRLEQAKDLDDRGLHETTACGNAGAHQDFSVQGDKAEQAIAELKQGKPIDWSEIGAALEVPSNPWPANAGPYLRLKRQARWCI